MAAIDVGSAATDRGDQGSNGLTELDTTNPANESGTLDTIEIWAAANMSGVKVGTFYGSVDSWTSRDVETLGNVTAGSKQTFSGLDIDVQTDDIIGHYNSGGTIELDTSGGSGTYYKSGDQFGAGTQTYTFWGNYPESLYGTGATVVGIGAFYQKLNPFGINIYSAGRG